MEQFLTQDGIPVLSARPGPAPRSSAALPLRQVDQWPSPDIYESLVAGCAALPHVRIRESRMASRQARALYLPDEIAAGPADAFIDQHEFCHLHPLPEGTIHPTLPVPVLERVMELGWAERHPISTAGILRTLVMVYT